MQTLFSQALTLFVSGRLTNGLHVNQISLVDNHDKAGNKCYTQYNTNNRENPSVRIGAREE